MYGAEVGVLHQTDEVGLGCGLQSKDCRSLEADLLLEFPYDRSYQALEGQLPDQKLGRRLEPLDLSQGNRARAEAARTLDTAEGLRLHFRLFLLLY